MKTTITFLLLLHTLFLHAQKVEQFYDYSWKPTDVAHASFYAILEQKNELWHRQDYFVHRRSLQMDGAYKDKDCKTAHGRFVYYYATGGLQQTGIYENGKRQGLWVRYHPNGMMADSITYEQDQEVGTSMGWHPNGYYADSTVLQNNGSGVSVSWFDNGNPSAAGRYAVGKKPTGKWQYYHKNGNLSAEEVFEAGVLRFRQYYDDNGVALKDTTNRDREATFTGGLRAWQRYLSQRLYFPTQYQITNSDRIVVVVALIIDEEGKVADAWIDTPFHPEFDKIALEAVQRSPKWQPAISHNRKVKFHVRQPVTFAHPD